MPPTPAPGALSQARRDMKRRIKSAVDDLFVNSAGQKADRLVLTTRDGHDLGGWGKQPMVDRLLKTLSGDTK